MRGAHHPAVHRELSQPAPLLSPQNAPHITLGPHLRPPFLGVPSALCQTPGEEWAVIEPFVSLGNSCTGRGPPGFACGRPPRMFMQDPPLLRRGEGRLGGVGPLGHLASWSFPSPPGFGFLPPAQAEMLARQQELLRKQNLAR